MTDRSLPSYALYRVLYASFRYGEDEAVRDARLFSNYSEGGFWRVSNACPELELVKLWQTADLRPERSDTIWLNVLLRKLAR